MLTQTKLISSKLLQETSKGPQLPLSISLAIELWSNLQIFSITLLPIVLQSYDKSQDQLSWALNKLFSYIQPLNVYNPLNQKSTAIIVIALCFLYFILFIGLFAFTALQIHARQKIKSFVSKTLNLAILFHSKVVFCLLHYFFVKIIDINTSCWASSKLYYCNVEWLIMAILLLILNITLAFFREAFCFQIHQINDTFGMKTNIQNLLILFQKFLPILFYYLIQNSDAVVILTNLILLGLILFVFHKRLPFYNIPLLKLNIVFVTIAFWTSLIGLARLFNTEKNLFVFMCTTMALAVKASLIRLNMRFREILNLKATANIFEAVHLPVLVEDHMRRMSIFPVGEKINKATLYSLGIIASKIDKIFEFKDAEKIELQELTDEFRKQTYLVVIKEMLDVLKRQPKSELLAICIAQIYIKEFGDAFQTMSIINKLRGRKLSLAANLSLEEISRDLSIIHQANSSQSASSGEEEKTSHLVYFSYKHKTRVFKKYVKVEIDKHLKLWRLLSHNNIDTMAVVREAEKISAQSRIIAQYWRQNFEGYELLFVNAAIIYGLYLEVVQALPSGGSSLIRKAFSAFNNKWHSQREIFDIIVGNSAIVVASIEPDKLGKVVEASSSIRTLFRTSKESLVGSNVGLIMPSVVAAKHNGFIKKYHKNSKRGFQRTLKTYAKTLDDEYFAVEINLQLSPLTNKGLNLVAHIKKISEFEPVVIVDEEGNIIEYSKNLALSLNLMSKRGNVKLQTLSSDLKLANQAFNIMYKPQEEILYTEKDKQDDFVIFEEELLQSPGITTTKNPFNLYSQENLLASPTRKELLMSSRENELPAKISNRFEKIMLSEGGESNTPKINIEDTEVVTITKEEAERICKQFKEGKKVNFLPLNKRVTPGENSQITCTTEIEPLIIESKLFKVLKLKGLLQSQEDAQKALSFEPPTSSIFHSQSAVVVKSVAETHDPEDDAFANQFPDEIERTLSSVTENPLEENGEQETAKKTQTRKTIQTQNHEALSFDPSELNIVKNNSDLSNPAKSRSRKAGTVAQSVIDSQATQRVTARKLNNSLKIEKQSYTARVTVIMVYVAVIIIISSICLNLIYTKKSIKDLSDSMSLISLVNTRLGKTIVLWQSLLILYARSIQLRPIDFRVPKYKAIALNATNDVINNTQRLSEELGNFADKDIVRKLYEKNVELWEPLTHKVFNDGDVDSLTAGQALLYYSGQFSGYNGSYLDLANTRGVLFALNNTANDYFVALQGTISDLSTFFTETHDNNVSLLKAITTLEALFLTLPLILILGILYITVKLYGKLFKAICKVRNESLLWRINQLENISKLFNEDIEDDILYLSDFKWREGKNTAKVISDKKAANKSRQFQRRGLILYGFKYTFLALIPLAIVMGLIISSLDRATQNLKDLNTINNRLQISFQLGSNIKEVLPSWYFDIIFHNDTSFLVRNRAPKYEMIKNIGALGDANKLLLEYFTNSEGVIDDPVVEDILRGEVCNYLLSDLYYLNCIQNTRGGEYGLLGLQPLYYQNVDLVKTWMGYTNPTQAQAVVLLVQYAAVVNNLHLILYDVYDSLTTHLLELFMTTAAEKETDTLKTFYVNLTAVLVAMLLIRTVVLTRLQGLDLGIRRILRIIPYKIIEENKVMSCYLAIAFQNELKVLKQIS